MKEVLLETYFSYLAIGLAAGTLAGMFGVGGGIIVVPLLTFLFQSGGYDPDQIIHIASGTSLATITVTSLSSTYAHNKKRAVFWETVFKIVPGIAIGAVIGAFIAHTLQGRTLEIIFGLFEIMVAGRIFSANRASACTGPSDARWKYFLGGGVIGTISSMLGVGGGTLVVPFLLWFRVSIREAIGIAAACGFPLAVFGSAGFIISGLGVSGLPESCLGYVHIPAFIFISIATFFSVPFGAGLAHSLPLNVLKNLFSTLLLVLGMGMLLKVV